MTDVLSNFQSNNSITPLFKEKIEKNQDFFIEQKAYDFFKLLQSQNPSKDETVIEKQAKTEALSIVVKTLEAVFDSEKFKKFFFEDFEPIQQDLKREYFLKPVQFRDENSLEKFVQDSMKEVRKKFREQDFLTTKILILNPDFYKAPWFKQSLPFFEEFKSVHGARPRIGFQIGTYIVEWNSQGILIPKLLNSRHVLGMFYLNDESGKPKSIDKKDIPKVCCFCFFFLKFYFFSNNKKNTISLPISSQNGILK